MKKNSYSNNYVFMNQNASRFDDERSSVDDSQIKELNINLNKE